jgi:uncharacterized repeat protein (TIGR02543 family)
MRNLGCILISGSLLFLISEQLSSQATFTGTELLGIATDHSITVNIVPDANIELYYEYGTVSGTYTSQTSSGTATGGQAYETVITGLQPDTKYYYRMQYRTTSPVGDWISRPEYSFHTQRTSGSTFIFDVASDSHAQYNTAYQNTAQNIINDHPDLFFDLGDTYMVDNKRNQTDVNNGYLAQRSSLYIGGIGHSIPVYLASGNHENEEGWNIDDTPFSIAVGSIIARKLYYPTPTTDGFYSGNDDPLDAIDQSTYGDQLREDYYAFTWGDALFVVIDPFQYTMNLPYAPGAAGEGTDDIQDGDQWSWSLGKQQFNWFKQTLENSTAKYKFVFCHNMTGGIPNLTISGVGPGYVRGGAGAAPYFEWGGKNADGTDGFSTHRNPSDFGTTPIHQLMVENGVSAYFHGHDHQYVYEKRDRIVYQEVPSPSMAGSGFGGIYSEGDHGDFQTIKMLPSSGHLRITIAPEIATVDYVNSGTAAINYSYTIEPDNSSSITYKLTISVDPEGSGTTNPSVGDHNYNENTIVNLNALPASGYQFDSWTGNVGNTSQPTTTITMGSDQIVTAHFIESSTIPGKAGDMNGDGMVNSTDALIILSCDVGINVAQFCPVNCGDVNGDGLINSTDALIILSYDVGMDVPFQIGGEGCPATVTPCNGCNPDK